MTRSARAHSGAYAGEPGGERLGLNDAPCPPFSSHGALITAPLRRRLARPDGSHIAYNPGSLVDYLLATNDFTDPVSRVRYAPRHAA